jgi:glycosyltransferase involved in cell wall biosynthesis
MRITLITTVFNEENSIIAFLESIASQTKLPDEVIIVDGGSKDKTIQKISEYKFPRVKNIPKLKVILKKGNRSVGRNEAIQEASSEIIAITDAGCILDKNWLNNLVKPFSDKSVDVVAGYYKGISKTIFQKCLIPFVLVMKDKVNEKDFLPATRSMAIKKSVWKKAGKFDEKLSHNEDYAFANKLKDIGAKIFFRKDAIVNWLPRKNLQQAFIMFFRFAFGDAQAKIFREKVVYIFLRYIFAFYLILLSGIERSKYLYGLDILLLVSYIVWAIFKNYRYVQSIKAIFYLPLLQFTSDLAVLLGTSFGLIRNFSVSYLVKIILNNKAVILVILVYIALMLSVISFGIPGPTHPFAYFMDEWHQSQSVRDVFRYGTPNMAGAANGSIFQFFLTGLYLVPFYLLHIVNIFAIKSSIANLSIQTILFEVLRLNTLIFGVLSLITVAYIVRKYFKMHPFLVVFFFAFNPLWITLSNYFKYDIALTFWILLAFLFMLRYVKHNTFLDFLLAGIFSSLALSTKLEPFNLLLVYIAVFFLFTSRFYTKIKYLFWGLLSYLVVFLFFGIPDVLLGKSSLVGYLTINLQSIPNAADNVMTLGMNYWLFFLSMLYPVSFGRVFYFAFIISIVVSAILLLWQVILKKISLARIFNDNKFLVTLLLILASYAASLIPMRAGALANRLVPLIPFMAIVIAYFASYLYKKINNRVVKTFLVLLICAFLVLQFTESIVWNGFKNVYNPRTVSSKWISENIKPGTLIGLENIPIYQGIPDNLLMEFYLKQYGKGQTNKYTYQIISSKTNNFPRVVVLTNEYIEKTLYPTSDKNLMVKELNMQKYLKIKTFTLQTPVFFSLNTHLEYFMSGLIQLPDTISIYEKQ